MADIQYLDDLLDVEVPAPDDGDVLYWDDATSLWKHKPIPVGEGGIIERVVRFSSDDCSAIWRGAAYDLSLTYDGVVVAYWTSTSLRRGAGMRFVNIYIPSGATIAHAYLKLTCRTSDNAIEVKSRIRGEKNIAPTTFSTIADYLARTRTDAQLAWDDIPTWTINELYQSPDIKAVIQEIINLPAWASGNSLVIFWDDHDDRTAHVDGKVRRARAFDHALPVPVMLYIEWTA